MMAVMSDERAVPPPLAAKALPRKRGLAGDTARAGHPMSVMDITAYFVIYLLVGLLLAAFGFMVMGLLPRSGRTVDGKLAAAAFPAVVMLAAGSLLVQQLAASARPSTEMGSVVWARPAWFAVYGLTLLLSGGLGYVVARSSIPRRGLVGALVASMMTVAFMVATLPLAEFINACFVGESFISNHRGCQ